MRNAICAVLLLATVLGASARAEDDAEEIAGRVQARYDETVDLSASFTQEMRIQAGGQVLRSKGRMYFERPGLMRWEYESPEPQTIVADGKHLWIHQPEDEQVLRAPLEQAFQSQTPVSFLFGVARIGRDFDPKMAEEGEDGGLRIELHPKAEEGGALGLLTLEVDPDSYDLRAATVRDPLGNVTEVRLIDPQRNEGVDKDLFHFERPPGTDIIEAPGG
ncbi:MAG: outer membrane lipoprotein chaperone LolA [Candidatus Binatia bacterium]|nr:outer membrane lipoprotein chaperone LolA [Candidatus Binatia bacterium]